MRIPASWFGALLLACLLFAVSSASAALLPVTNPSFETLPGGGLPLPCGVNCSYSMGAIPGWTTTGNVGQFQPGPPTNTSVFNSIPNGSTIGYSNGGTIVQSVGSVSAAAITYMLMVDIGLRKDFPNTGSIQLLIGSTSINAVGAAPTSGNFSTFTASFVTSAANIGQAITIQLASSGAQGDFDNVRLDASSSSLPEPATMGLLLFGLAGFGVAARLRRRA